MRARFLTVVLLFFSPVSAQTEARHSEDVNCAISMQYAAIISSANDDARARNLQSLEHLLSKLNRKETQRISDLSVMRISGLLEDDREFSKYYAARALSVISCRSKLALPALKLALRHERNRQPGQLEIGLALGPDAYVEIRSVIQKIEAAVPCDELVAQ